MNIIALDIASEVTAACIMNARGKVLREELLPTQIADLRALIGSVRSPRQVVFEQCEQAAWLWSSLEGWSEDVLICNPRENKRLSGEKKSDRSDALNLAEAARRQSLVRVWHGGEDQRKLKERWKQYQILTREQTRLKNQMKGVLRSRGVLATKRLYTMKTRESELSRVTGAVFQERVRQLGAVLDVLKREQRVALRELTREARKQAIYTALRTVPAIGPVFAALFLAEVGCPGRFRGRRQFFSYCGLAVSTFESGEYEVRGGRIVRKLRAVRTRGLVNSFNRPLKTLFKQTAMTLSRTTWKPYYLRILENSKCKEHAQLTLARRLASIMLRIAKTGEPYDVAKAFSAQ
jgi:transposase